MKSKCVFASMALIIFFNLKDYAQINDYSIVPSEHLAVTYNKTTNLIFPYSVKSIDRGSRDILVQQPKGTENIVQVKAAKPNFLQTNLSVITTDGKLYSFTVDYSAQPSELNIVIENNVSMQRNSISNQIVKLESANNEAQFKSVAEAIFSMKPKHGKRDYANEMQLHLNGIYINQDMFYFRFELKNNSNVSYDIDNIKFTVKDRQQSKRTATQETQIMPAFKTGNFETVKPDSINACIIVLPKFTLPDSKFLFIQVLEKNGGRNLTLVLKNRQIMKATSIK